VITPETMKKDKVASVGHDGQRERREMRLGDGRLKSTRVGVIVSGTDGKGWDGGMRGGPAWDLYLQSEDL
jgi:hypothetical protein